MTVDLSACADSAALWARLLAALGAPGWHGANLDALWDGLTGGLIAPPEAVLAVGRGNRHVEAEWARIAAVLAEAGVPVRRG